MQTLPLSKRTFWITVLGVSAGVLGALALNVLGVQFILKNWVELARARQTINASETRRSDILAADRILAGLGAERALIMGVSVDPANPLPLIEAIEGLGTRLGVQAKLALASSGGSKKSQGYLISATGSFRNIMSFFTNIEALPFLVEFGDIDIRKISVGSFAAGEKTSTEPDLALSILVQPISP